MLGLNKKGQGLPLNTVVIAILVILVLVIIIVYFTTSMSETGDSIDQNTAGVNACELGSYIIPDDKYDSPSTHPKGYDCSSIDKERIYSANTGKEDEPVCCVGRKNS